MMKSNFNQSDSEKSNNDYLTASFTTLKSTTQNDNPLGPRSNSYSIPISINKSIKSAFNIVLQSIGIDIMNPTDFIEAIYSYLLEENNSQRTEEFKKKIENFVKNFIFFLVNCKFSSLEQTFGVEENFLKILLKKQLFKCNYLRHHSIESYKKKDNIQEKNFFIIYNVIKSIEYKYGINIIGIGNYKENKKDSLYSCELKFNWFIKFIDYLIVGYLNKNNIIPFSQFINSLEMKKEIEKFDRERAFDLSNFYCQEKEEKFIKKLIYVVENVIYHLINKK